MAGSAVADCCSGVFPIDDLLCLPHDWHGAFFQGKDTTMATTFVSSAKLAEVQTRADAPFSALFLGITCAQEAESPIDGKTRHQAMG